MKTGKQTTKTLILLLLILANLANTQAQTSITGYVKDAATNAPLSNVSITIKGQRGGSRTNSDGQFSIPANKVPLDILVSIVGYNPSTLHLDSLPQQGLQIG